MTLELNHECTNCGGNPKQDECYCDSCRESYASDAYEAGKEEGQKLGYDEGYAAAEKELAKTE